MDTLRHLLYPVFFILLWCLTHWMSNAYWRRRTMARKPRKFEPVVGTVYKAGFQRLPQGERKHCWRCMALTEVELVGRSYEGMVKVPVCEKHGREIGNRMDMDLGGCMSSEKGVAV